MSAARHALFLAVGAIALAVVACGGDPEPERRDPFASAKREALEQQPAEPRWEQVARLAGTGGRAERLKISPHAIQWRVRWHCTSGSITLSVSSRGDRDRVRRRSSCRAAGRSAFVETGVVRLAIDAAGQWRAVVEEQLSTPLEEPPLKAMRSPGARIIARGRFYPVESPGEGWALLYRLPNARLALRLRDLRTSPEPDLVVWASEARKPETTAQAAAARHVALGRLKSTRGDQNYLLPRGLDPPAAASVVIWSPRPTRMAFTAAALK